MLFCNRSRKGSQKKEKQAFARFSAVFIETLLALFFCLYALAFAAAFHLL